jgi:uncharacterized protein YndB with AHSA1/START domain
MEPIAKAEMLIRRPVEDVFEAFLDPAITSKFWFSKGSGRLEPGKTVTWTWGMYGFSVEAKVKAVEKNRSIVVEWPSTIEWTFIARPDGTTVVSVANSGFTGSDEDKMIEALGSTEGFTFLLAGAKAWLEHGIELNLVRDRFPDGLPGQDKDNGRDRVVDNRREKGV